MSPTNNPPSQLRAAAVRANGVKSKSPNTATNKGNAIFPRTAASRKPWSTREIDLRPMNRQFPPLDPALRAELAFELDKIRSRCPDRPMRSQRSYERQFARILFNLNRTDRGWSTFLEKDENEITNPNNRSRQATAPESKPGVIPPLSSRSQR
jgi:hypothetical protein